MIRNDHMKSTLGINKRCIFLLQKYKNKLFLPKNKIIEQMAFEVDVKMVKNEKFFKVHFCPKYTLQLNFYFWEKNASYINK